MVEHKLDTAYLREHVGSALSAGLAQLALKNPADSVDFLGNWLLSCIENRRRDVEIQSKVASRLDQASKAEQARKEAAVKALSGSKAQTVAEVVISPEAIEQKGETLLANLRKTHSYVDLYNVVLTDLRKETKASSSYLGLLEETEDDTPATSKKITFATAVPMSSAKVMAGRTFGPDRLKITYKALGNKKVPKIITGEEPSKLDEEKLASVSKSKPSKKDDESEETGTDSENGSEATDTEDELSEESDDEERQKKKKEEKSDANFDLIPGLTVHITNVFKEPDMHYFGIPKPGAFLCVPIKMASGQLRGVVGLDTLGLGRAFLPEEIALVEWMCNTISPEMDRIATEIEAKLQAENVALLQSYEAERENKERVIELELSEEDENRFAFPEDKLVVVAEKRLQQVRQELNNLSAKKIEELIALKAPPVVLFSVVKALLTLFDGGDMKEKEMKTWTQCRLLLSPEFFQLLQTYDVGEKNKKKWQKVMKFSADIDGDGTVRQASFAGFLLFEFFSRVLELRQATEQALTAKEMAEAEKIAAEGGQTKVKEKDADDDSSDNGETEQTGSESGVNSEESDGDA